MSGNPSSREFTLVFGKMPCAFAKVATHITVYNFFVRYHDLRESPGHHTLQLTNNCSVSRLKNTSEIEVSLAIGYLVQSVPLRLVGEAAPLRLY
jgi:hypothetical protein